MTFKKFTAIFVLSIGLFACNTVDEKTLAHHTAVPSTTAMATIKPTINIIPEPAELVINKGSFHLNSATKIIADEHEQSTALYFQQYLANATGSQLVITSDNSNLSNTIIFQINTTLAKTLGDEGYKLTVTSENIVIAASAPAGLFYGVQTIRQLLPNSLEQKNNKTPLNFTLANMKITDKPQYAWRSFMFDEARFLHGKKAVYKLLDQMALLKMNKFHWHLTDHEGWRLEIKQYPKLTSVGAYRTDSQSGGTQEWNSKTFIGEPHGGFYTQEDVKEVLEYAQQLHISVIPEIEMPGHSAAAIAAYPWLGTDTKAIDVPTRFGKHKAVYNIADPRVVEFNKNVLDEVMALFPSKVIHIGGDEVLFDHWKASDEINQLMRDKNLTSYAELQVDFTNTISQYLNSKGRRMMGWNDILGGNVHNWQKSDDVKVNNKLAQNSIIHFWKGDTKLLTKALDDGYQIVNALHTRTYLDYTYKMISVKKAYNFNPVPKGISAKQQENILGISCQMWGEFIPTIKKMENLVYPRIAAYAEVAWTSPSNKNYPRFEQKLNGLKKRWDVQDIAYHRNK